MLISTGVNKAQQLALCGFESSRCLNCVADRTSICVYVLGHVQLNGYSKKTLISFLEVLVIFHLGIFWG